MIFKSSLFVFNKNTGFHRNNELCSMPILNTRDLRATRFESSASNDIETNTLIFHVSRGISRRTSCILFT